jgi:hypothetical protein
MLLIVFKQWMIVFKTCSANVNLFYNSGTNSLCMLLKVLHWTSEELPEKQ